ncbi:uncharacterized protein LOC119667977 [Teleopsis dalmanni]|uniref:uncharacterized protein LOC119667977 n=1 Tax=Teleopsis dalmanni TaxID=139649 RepID=UPI0018CD53A4|nr:uncharacterized protein LOC119667977 [Teleopsis dalmanni]
MKKTVDFNRKYIEKDGSDYDFSIDSDSIKSAFSQFRFTNEKFPKVNANEFSSKELSQLYRNNKAIKNTKKFDYSFESIFEHQIESNNDLKTEGQENATKLKCNCDFGHKSELRKCMPETKDMKKTPIYTSYNNSKLKDDIALEYKSTRIISTGNDYGVITQDQRRCKSKYIYPETVVLLTINLLLCILTYIVGTLAYILIVNYVAVFLYKMFQVLTFCVPIIVLNEFQRIIKYLYYRV